MDCRVKPGNDAVVANDCHCEERSDEAIQLFMRGPELLRGACHPARIRATRGLAMTRSQPHVSCSFTRAFMMLCARSINSAIAARSFTIAEQINLEHLCRTVP
jgi:hypothetical protein